MIIRHDQPARAIFMSAGLPRPRAYFRRAPGAKLALFGTGDTRPRVSYPRAKQGGVMAKRHCRPSAQYRYEHYDPQ